MIRLKTMRIAALYALFAFGNVLLYSEWPFLPHQG